MNLREEIKKMRTEAGMTQTKLAEIAGTHQTVISRFESEGNKFTPRLSVLERVAQACGYRVLISFERETHLTQAGDSTDTTGCPNERNRPE